MTMENEDKFDLSEFMTDSLSLQVNAAPTRMQFSQKFEDPYLKLLDQEPKDIMMIRNWGPLIKNEDDDTKTPIEEFFYETNVLITGATGFIGKVLIQKLIRSFPRIGQIFLLIRKKRGKTPPERLNLLFQDELFARMRAEVPNYRNKITLVEGDISEPGLELTSADHVSLTTMVNIVFHSAADVRFIEPLKPTIVLNVIGTKRVLSLSKKMRNLKSFVHVSTAYSYCVLRNVPESVPKLPTSYKDVLDFVESQTQDEVEKNLDKLLMGWPNSYTFSKAVCEDMIQEECQGMPICIFRPGVVGNTYREPVRGWTDNLYGPVGLFVGAGLGVIHCTCINQDLAMDIVPVDYVVNGMIASAWKNTDTRHNGDISVYNFTLPEGAKKNWKTTLGLAYNYRDIFPFQQAIYYASGFVTESYLVYEIAFFFLHKLPGIFFDTLLILAGHKPRLSKIYKRLQKLKKPLSFFTFRGWFFQNNNVINLWNSLNSKDKVNLYFNMDDLDIKEYFFLCKVGDRYFYLKEKIESIKKTHIKNTWLKWAHYSLMTIAGIVFLKCAVLIAHALPI